MSNQDMFGHTINFNFNGSSDQHRTVVGGVMSILVKVFLLFYIYTLVYRFWNLGDPNNDIISRLVKVDSLGLIKLNTTRVFPFWVLKK